MKVEQTNAIKTNKYFVPFQIFILIVFLIFVTVFKSLEITLPLYIVASVLPYIKSFKKLPDGFCAFFFLISIAYLIYGVIWQDTIAAITSFCTRLYQFMIMMLLFKNQRVLNVSFSIRKVVVIAIVIETILGIYFILTGKMTSEAGLVRLVAGNQPVEGNLTVVLLPIFIWTYFHDLKNRRFIIWSSLLLGTWIVLSGTRGYLLLFIFSMLYIYFDYLFFEKKAREEWIVLFIIICVLVFFILFLTIMHGNQFIALIKGVFRLNEGTGRRDRENQIAILTFEREKIHNKLLGIGLGGSGNAISGYANIVFSVWGGKWGYYRYIDASGAPFHCLYSNILLLQGILGCCLIIGIFFWGMFRIFQCEMAKRAEKACLSLFWIGFFIMNYFRWTCDCGIAEMIFFTIILNKLSAKNIVLKKEHKRTFSYKKIRVRI